MSPDPVVALADEPLRISLQGLAAGASVEVQATLGTLSSRTAFVATADDHTLDGGALLSALAPDGPTLGELELDDAPLRVRFDAFADGHRTASAEALRLLVGAGVSVEACSIAERSTHIYVPSTTPARGVLVLGGSGGGEARARAALLASHGLLAMTFDYLDDLAGPTPLERPLAAVDALADDPRSLGERVAVCGISMGAQLSLLLALHSAKVDAAVSINGSDIAAGNRLPDGSLRAWWSRDGRPLASAGIGSTPDEVAAASIPAEDIAAAVLLVSGGRDRIWIAKEMHENVFERLQRRRPDAIAHHLVYPDAGHVLGPPFLGDASGTFQWTDGSTTTLGGTAAANAQANADLWPRVIEFLEATANGSAWPQAVRDRPPHLSESPPA